MAVVIAFGIILEQLNNVLEGTFVLQDHAVNPALSKFHIVLELFSEVFVVLVPQPQQDFLGN